MTYPDRIEKLVREYPDWSPAERRRMDRLVEEVLDHCASGQGSAFVRAWCDKYIPKPAEELRFDVTAEINAADGGGDGAYGLLSPPEGWTREEVLLHLGRQLLQTVKDSLWAGRELREVGHEIVIRIRDWKPEVEDCDDA